ncbi:MAG TPA: hypothetical protein VN420_02210 [Candidatus Fimivivens sp.]|nr:hypothetical protein [Candidatus Fimivivens sp.]
MKILSAFACLFVLTACNQNKTVNSLPTSSAQQQEIPSSATDDSQRHVGNSTVQANVAQKSPPDAKYFKCSHDYSNIPIVWRYWRDPLYPEMLYIDLYGVPIEGSSPDEQLSEILEYAIFADFRHVVPEHARIKYETDPFLYMSTISDGGIPYKTFLRYSFNKNRKEDGSIGLTSYGLGPRVR